MDQNQNIYEEAIKNGFNEDKVWHYETKRALEIRLYEELNEGDALMIKGGRRMYLNTTIRKLFNMRFGID